jgi:hypothetical protein
MVQTGERLVYPYERLSDLTNGQANKILKECYSKLESCLSDEDFILIPEKMQINDELFQDLIELMKLKGWLSMD